MVPLNQSLVEIFLRTGEDRRAASPDAGDAAASELPSQPAMDVIWQGVRRAAADVAKREPVLQRRLQKLVLDRSSLADAIAAVISDRLATADMCEPSLHALVRELIDDERSILHGAATDLHAVKTRDPACRNHLHVLLNMKGFHALQTYRIAHSLWRRDRKELAFVLSNRASVVYCVDIHPAARIGAGVMLDHGSGIVIGETAVVDDNVSILQNVTLGGTGKERGDRHPKVRYGVMIGAGAKILGNIEIGAMSKVAAGSVVLEPVPPHSTVAGVPAKIVRRHRNSGLPALDMDQSVTGARGGVAQE
jgi:serine O-acetyltransferase